MKRLWQGRRGGINVTGGRRWRGFGLVSPYRYQFGNSASLLARLAYKTA